ncbi:hypothetical protein [Albidovulum sediminis]|uniref:MarR family transcriptional regulator n=1 Tax=Albidovulum sediminis TaxID=3066345 RepID=A0ABT2NH78_9RHOB|nr:hypothetical protein [Defluviimonas sediminis]MCT8328272.1 hypothetical protein [Defluviimonas sediminis]
MNRQAASPASEIEAEFAALLRSMTHAQFGRFLDMIEKEGANAR